MRATLLTLLLAACSAASRELKACSGVNEDSATPRPPKPRKYRYAPRRGRGGDEQEVSLMPPRPGKPKKAGPFRSRGS